MVLNTYLIIDPLGSKDQYDKRFWHNEIIQIFGVHYFLEF